MPSAYNRQRDTEEAIQAKRKVKDWIRRTSLLESNVLREVGRSELETVSLNRECKGERQAEKVHPRYLRDHAMADLVHNLVQSSSDAELSSFFNIEGGNRGAVTSRNRLAKENLQGLKVHHKPLGSLPVAQGTKLVRSKSLSASSSTDISTMRKRINHMSDDSVASQKGQHEFDLRARVEPGSSKQHNNIEAGEDSRGGMFVGVGMLDGLSHIYGMLNLSLHGGEQIAPRKYIAY